MTPLTPENLRLGRLFHRCYVCTRRTINPTIHSLGITLRDIWVMNVALENHVSTQTEMSKILDLNENVVVRMVDHLEELGYVRRQEGATDARTREVKLTPKGLEAYRKAHVLMDPAYSRLLDHMTEDEQLTLKSLLQKYLQPK